MTGRTAKEKALLDAVESAIEVVRPEAQRQIKTRMFYPYISDSSFMAVCDDTLAIQALETNMPQYGVKYTHPVDKIRQIDVPVVNIGTFGRDICSPSAWICGRRSRMSPISPMRR